jgi:3-methyladenine DNA glycosylase/8-oxoguanine DNA glycosylase
VRESLPADFDREGAMAFLAARAVPALECVTPHAYSRSLRVAGRAVSLSCRFEGGTLVAHSVPALPLGVLREHVRRLFDLGTNLGGFRAVAERDPLLRRLTAGRPAVRVLQFLDPFEGIVRAVLGQQVSLAAARTMADRLVRLVPRAAPSIEDFRPLVFPTAPQLTSVGTAGLRGIGLTGAKAATLLAVARAASSGLLDWERFRYESAEATEATLMALPGIGPWTAAYTRMRCLGDPDAFPAGDLGVRHALAKARPSGEPWTERRARGLAEAWRPWRSYATLALWASLA